MNTNAATAIACDATPAEAFGPNYLRLQKLKAKYDPNNVFNKLHAITPSLESLYVRHRESTFVPGETNAALGDR